MQYKLRLHSPSGTGVFTLFSIDWISKENTFKNILTSPRLPAYKLGPGRNILKLFVYIIGSYCMCPLGDGDDKRTLSNILTRDTLDVYTPAVMSTSRHLCLDSLFTARYYIYRYVGCQEKWMEEWRRFEYKKIVTVIFVCILLYILGV